MAPLHLSLRPAADDLPAVAALPRPPQEGVRWLDRGLWHVTLRFLGDCDPDEVGTALDGARLPHVTPRLGPTVTLLGRHHLVVPVRGVGPLQVAVQRATRGIGRPPADRPFVGHLTLASLADGVRPPLLGAAVSDDFDGAAVALVDSVAAEGGRTHRVVATWPTVR